MTIIRFQVNDVVELKKPHPCGSKQFKILRVGSDVRILCMGCSRDMVMDRIKLEKATKKLLTPASNQGESNETKE